MKKKVVILLAHGFETVEALTPVNYLRLAAVDVTICSCENDNIIRSNTDVKVLCDLALKDVSVADYDMLIVPGGKEGYERLIKNTQVLDIISDFQRADKWIAAICAAPLVLQKAGVLDHKYHTSYPLLEEYFDPKYYRDDLIVCDDKLITARGPSAALEFSIEILRVLRPPNIVEIIKESTVYNLSRAWICKK